MIWCEMQIEVWMAYSDSMHFSDKLSYKIHFIPSYGWKDINFARLHTCSNFQKNKTEIVLGLFSPRIISARVADRRGRCDDAARWLGCCCRGGAGLDWQARPICQRGLNLYYLKRRNVFQIPPLGVPFVNTRSASSSVSSQTNGPNPVKTFPAHSCSSYHVTVKTASWCQIPTTTLPTITPPKSGCWSIFLYLLLDKTCTAPNPTSRGWWHQGWWHLLQAKTYTTHECLPTSPTGSR
jgi:hypothetical protein